MKRGAAAVAAWLLLLGACGAWVTQRLTLTTDMSAFLPPAATPSGPPQWSSTPSQRELAVRSSLETVMDPEIGLSVIDLGLIREIHFVENKTVVRMMLTTPFCPYAPQMMADVKNATESAVAQPCEVDMLADPWSPEMMPDPSLLGFSF